MYAKYLVIKMVSEKNCYLALLKYSSNFDILQSMKNNSPFKTICNFIVIQAGNVTDLRAFDGFLRIFLWFFLGLYEGLTRFFAVF
jgi:hypothetical protein